VLSDSLTSRIRTKRITRGYARREGRQRRTFALIVANKLRNGLSATIQTVRFRVTTTPAAKSVIATTIEQATSLQMETLC